jgi:hypothetical protein
MNRILKAYLKRLTNLSTRNKSLLLPGLPSEQFLDLHDLDFLLGKSSFELIRQFVQRKPKVQLCDIQDPRFEKVNEASKRLRKISRTEHYIEEERGSRDLYVGYPFVRGKLADGTPVHAPLLFFPVTLKTERQQWLLAERDESGIILNRSFALAYTHFNEVTIPDEILEKSFEDFSKDALEFRTQLYEWLKETPFKINFNQQLFDDKLTPYDVVKSSDLVRIEKQGELKLYPEAVLGIFPQAGSYLVPDYNVLLNQEEKQLFHILLTQESEEPVIGSEPIEAPVKPLSAIKEVEVLTPFSIDESQEEIIRSVKEGKSVVVQGPPGSGKSQLICNLMADFASQGKRVLLVCQKRAALDVVYHRLKTIGMDAFVALIHDFKNDRPELYRQLASQIEKVEDYKKQNYGLDAVFLERQFAQESRQIDRILESLDGFRSALFDDRECGVSVKELYLTSDQSKPYIELDDYYRFFRPDTWGDYRKKLRAFARYSLLFQSGHPWEKRIDFSKFTLRDLRVMETMLLEWPEAFRKQKDLFESITGLPFSNHFTTNRGETIERLTDISELVGDNRIYELFKEYTGSGSLVQERLAFIRQTTEALEGFMAEDGIEFSLKTLDIPSFRSRLKKVIESKQSVISGLFWDMFGSDKKEISAVAVNNKLTLTSEDLTLLDLRIRNRVEMENWLVNPVLGFDKKHLDETLGIEDQFLMFFNKAEKAADASSRSLFDPWYSVILHLVERSPDVEIFKSHIDRLIRWLGAWERLENAMTPFLIKSQIDDLMTEPGVADVRMLEALRSDFDSMVDMDQTWLEMNATEQTVTRRIVTASQKLRLNDVDEIVSLFENSVRLAWVNHIENKFPDLRAVNSLKMNQWEGQLQESTIQKERLSGDIVRINLREHTYEDVEKNRLGNRVTYRELNHQVTKKRKVWPIRKLLENHSDEIFSLVPCWMTSPESASAMFPMTAGLFDLVIFDEASQCYAEYGLPAAFRGKQIVVTGDSRQLSPNDLYRIRFAEKSEDDEIPVELEVESLLDLAAQSLEQHQLSGHYRSLSLDLIDFSNHHFYKDSLRLLPDFNRINAAEPGIEYIKVEGLWKNNVNLVECEKVLELLHGVRDTGKTVGVVTFNFFQQQTIQEAIERENILLNELFVKNIENVQGDERDVIIFTMGYALDEKGKLSMQFGSLNTQGGENRLNVAVTRAREKIYFITSLFPAQLQTEQTANAGPKLLKAYMQYALDVSEGNYRPKPLSTSAFRQDWFLKDRLVQLKPEYHKELPFADVTVKDEQGYKGLVLTDDDMYYQSKSSKEPHAYLPLLLRRKNWPFQRVYSREYWMKKLGGL